MRVLEQRIVGNGESLNANASMVDMQQTIKRLMTQCNEKSFELEIKSADNRVLQEQLQNKCAENKELQEKVFFLEHRLALAPADKSSSSFGQGVFDEYVDELKKKIQSQEFEKEKFKLEHVQLSEDNSGLLVQNQKLCEEASYAKELAAAAAVELKNLAGEITKVSLQNAKLEKELVAARELAHARGGANAVNRKFGDGMRRGRKGRVSGQSTDFGSWSLDLDDLKMEVQARKQREAALEAALAEKELVEDEYRKKVEEAKRREQALENDLANMWVLVAKLKKEGGRATPDSNVDDDRYGNGTDRIGITPANDNGISHVLKERQISEESIPAVEINNEEPLVARLKARMQEMKDKEERNQGNGDTNSHICKICFESPKAAVLLPCRHFCLCKSCSLACSECPICRTKISDRLFAFAS
ncbi:kinesin-like protein KIN-7D, mitochondrial [Rutidosis leptorrhynchoides]|uniref:kinesin-like protein KIN-7D, mitochondrial n=1 Tax=Rutidosis leptorrhynchoides TaxID=125765 RepID=UPI003A990B69